MISAERVIPAYDLLTSLGLPELKHAQGSWFYPNRYARILPIDLRDVGRGNVYAGSGTFKTDESLEIGGVDFIISSGNEYVVYYTAVNGAQV